MTRRAVVTSGPGKAQEGPWEERGKRSRCCAVAAGLRGGLSRRQGTLRMCTRFASTPVTLTRWRIERPLPNLPFSLAGGSDCSIDGEWSYSDRRP
jgi:hypothetical protein